MTQAGIRTWGEYVDMLRPLESLIDLTWKPQDEAYRADFYRQLMMNLSYGYFQYFQSNAEHPEFMPLWNSVYLFQPNPDDVYFYAPLDGRLRYRIVGDRGSIHMINFQFGHGMLGMVEEVGNQHSSFLDGPDLVLDADGKFHAVIALEDPGVPNWLDTGGFTEGTIIGRWMQCSSAPLPELTLVPLETVRDHLPAGTPVTSPEEREANLRQRRIGAQLRRRW